VSTVHTEEESKSFNQMWSRKKKLCFPVPLRSTRVCGTPVFQAGRFEYHYCNFRKDLASSSWRLVIIYQITGCHTSEGSHSQCHEILNITRIEWMKANRPEEVSLYVYVYNYMYMYRLRRLTTGICFEKWVVRRFLRANVYLHKPR
jgi:hypothetical protein